MDRAALWKALRSFGAPPFLVQLIEHLDTGTTSLVRVGGELSEPFEITSGVRQGCVLAPALFCIAVDWILSSCIVTMGTTVGSSNFTDQDYADDAVLFSEVIRRFPDSHFPGQTFPGQDDSRTDVSRTRRFPDRHFPDKRIPGETFPGQGVFQAPFSRKRFQ